MAQLAIPYGSVPNDPNQANDIPLRTAFQRTHDNFTDLYALQSRIVNAGDVRFSGQPTNEAKISAARQQAAIELATIVFIPEVMTPFDPTLVDFTNNAVRNVVEGGDFSMYDVQAYGADATGVLDAGPSWNTCRANIPTSGGVMRATSGTYKLTTAFTFSTHDNITLIIDPGVTLSGSALPDALRSDNNAIIDYRSGFSVTNRITIPIPTTVTPNLGPLAIDGNESVFAGTSDPTLVMGYNMTAAGQLIVGGEPAAAWSIEGNYNDGSGANKMEAYVQFLGTDFSMQRPFFASYNRTTRKATPFIYGDTIQFGRGNQTESIARIDNDGVNGAVLTILPALVNASYVSIEGKTGTEGFVRFGITGTTLGKLTCTGSTRVDLLVNGRSDSLHVYATPNGGAGDAMAVGINDNGAVATFNNSSSQNGLPVVRARGRNGQTADLFRAESFTPATLWAITATGNMNIGANQVVGARRTGWTAWTGTAARGTQNADAPPTTTQIAQAFKALLDDLIAHGLVGT